MAGVERETKRRPLHSGEGFSDFETLPPFESRAADLWGRDIEEFGFGAFKGKGFLYLEYP